MSRIFLLDAADVSGRRRLDDPHDLVRREVEAALRQPDRLTIPVLIQGAKMRRAEDLPSPLKALVRRNGLEAPRRRRWTPRSRAATAGVIAVVLALTFSLYSVLGPDNREVPNLVGAASAFEAEAELLRSAPSRCPCRALLARR